MAIEVVNPFDSFAGNFETSDIDSRAILDSLDKPKVVNYINDIPLDVLEEFTYDSKFEVSQRPVESGFTTTYSRRKLPPTIVISGIQVTGQDPDTPIETEGTSALEGKSWKDKYSDLMELKDRNEIVTLTTSLDTFPELLIDAVRFVRIAVNKADALFFTISFRKSTFSESQIAEVDPSMLPKERRAKKKPVHTEGDDQKSSRRDRGNLDPEKDNSTLLRSGLQWLAKGVV